MHAGKTRCSKQTRMIPRCYTCNAYLAAHRPAYDAARARGETSKQALQQTGLTRMCCRMHVVTYVNLTEDFARFPNKDVVLDDLKSTYFRNVAHARRVRCDTGEITADQEQKEAAEDMDVDDEEDDDEDEDDEDDDV